MKPDGELTIQVMCMPADTNPHGFIFGGWLLSQMDLAGGILSKKIAKGPCVTVAIDSTTFKYPVYIGDVLSCYVKLKKIGKTSISVHVEAWVTRELGEEFIKVTEGDFTYVKVDKNRKPLIIEK